MILTRIIFMVIFLVPNNMAQIVFATTDGDIGVWDVNTGSYLNGLKWKAHTDQVRCIKVLKNGNLLSGSDDGTMSVWNMTNITPFLLLQLNQSDAVYAVEELWNGYIVSGGLGELFIWNPNTGDLLSSINNAHSSSIYCLRSLANGLFASASSDSTIKIWSPNSWSNPTAVRTLSGHNGAIKTLELLSNGYLISGSTDTYSIVWDYNTGVQIGKFRPVNNKNVYCIKELSNGSVAFGGYDASIYIWSISGSGNQSNQSLIYTVSNILSGEMPCVMFASLYKNNYLAVASSGVNTEFLTVNSPRNISYYKTFTLDTSSYVTCIDQIYINATTISNTTDNSTASTILITSTNTMNIYNTTNTTIAVTNTTANTTGTITEINQTTTNMTTKTTVNTITSTTPSTTTNTTSTTTISTISTTKTTIITTTTSTTTTRSTTTTTSSTTKTTTTTKITTTTILSTVKTTTAVAITTIEQILFMFEFSIDDLTIQAYISILNSTYDFSDCIVNCSNKGMCKYANNKTFICVCQANYGGKTCQQNLLPCSHSPCLNNATCYQTVSQNTTSDANYSCQCLMYYYGTNCQYKIDICENRTCSNNGVCKDINNTATCQCFSMYSGVNCEIESAQRKVSRTVTTSASIVAFTFIGCFFLLTLLSDLRCMCNSSSYRLKKKSKKSRSKKLKPIYHNH